MIDRCLVRSLLQVRAPKAGLLYHIMHLQIWLKITFHGELQTSHPRSSWRLFGPRLTKFECLIDHVLLFHLQKFFGCQNGGPRWPVHMRFFFYHGTNGYPSLTLGRVTIFSRFFLGRAKFPRECRDPSTNTCFAQQKLNKKVYILKLSAVSF